MLLLETAITQEVLQCIFLYSLYVLLSQFFKIKIINVQYTVTISPIWLISSCKVFLLEVL